MTFMEHQTINGELLKIAFRSVDIGRRLWVVFTHSRVARDRPESRSRRR
jgi:hypothetical protein